MKNIPINGTSPYRIYIDCTDTFHSQLNTGIQRVVRNIVNNSSSVGNILGIECIPIILQKDSYTRVGKLTYSTGKRNSFRLRQSLNLLYLRLISAIINRSSFEKLNDFLTASKHEFGLTRFILKSLSPFFLILNLIQRLRRERQHINNEAENSIEPSEGDILLLIDSIWNYDFSNQARKSRARGAVVIAVIYDIIPITHPEFVDSKNRINFEDCLPKLYNCTDGFLSISKYTESTISEYYKNKPYSIDFQSKNFNYFYLGSELDVIDNNQNCRSFIKKTFENSSTYLMVGTIEPRKNHIYAIDAFNILWLEKINASLVIIGKIGWMCEDIIKKIYAHPMYGVKLFFIKDASDAELNYGYSHAKALLFPAFIEGFGLPIIEAQRKGLPVFASDIPVFREVAQNSVAYFDNKNPQNLADMLLKYERTGQFPAIGPQNFSWPTWKQCTHQMLTQLINMTQEIQSNKILDTANIKK